MTTQQELYIRKGVYYLSGYSENEFENLYLQVRKKENRIYTDYELKNLPNIKKSHLSEWMIRKNSAEKVAAYLKNKNKPLNIMDLGCGNGWLTHYIAQIKDSYIIGVDINRYELEQAARVFKNHKFFFADIFADNFELGDFDIILLAGSIQYFRNANHLIERLLYLATRNGEIHIFDSPLYNPKEIPGAKSRTRKYYEKLGFSNMAEFYFHHSIDELKIFDPVFLYKPKKRNLFSRFLKDSSSPFPWIMIRNNS
jgi:SAM-dependent methyltransferase